MSPSQQLDQLRACFEEFRQHRMSPHDFSREARQLDTLLPALPPAFGEVLGQLLDRLESSALFTEESCSFSQQGLIDHLQVWLDKARSRLA